MTFKEFLENKKKEQKGSSEKKVDWEARKEKWLSALDTLYQQVDQLIVKNFQEAGYSVTTSKEETKITEDYIGTYTANNYIVDTDTIRILFNPIGTIIIGAYGRVNMVLPNETVILALPKWDEWKIVKGIGHARKIIDFNEQNLMEIFSDNL